jgi:hypothetical protein
MRKEFNQSKYEYGEQTDIYLDEIQLLKQKIDFFTEMVGIPMPLPLELS